MFVILLKNSYIIADLITSNLLNYITKSHKSLMVNNPEQAITRLGFVLLMLIMLSACAAQHQAGQSPRSETDSDTYMTSGNHALEIDNDPSRMLAVWEENLSTFSIADPEHITLSADGSIETDDRSPNAVPLKNSRHFNVIHHHNHDLWERIREGFALPDRDHPLTRAEKLWYSKHQEYINRTVTRARPYLHYITEEAEKRGMPTEIVLLPIIESAFQPFAYSHGRAAGIWQFIPATASHYGLKQNWWYDGRRDIMASTVAALDYLEALKNNFDGEWLLALAAYNSGQGTVANAIRYNKRHGRPTDFWSLRLPEETRAYVPKLLAISAIVADPEKYNITLESIPDEPYLVKVDVGSQIDLALAAELAGISIEDLYRLNPGFNRWATDPDGPHQLVLSIDKAEHFQAKLAELPVSKRIKWTRYEIREGETLSHIAVRYRTTVSLLREVNKLRTNFIKAGDNLIIPVATKKINDYALTLDQRTRAIQNAEKKGLKVSYIVKDGDSLWEIARKYDVSVKELATWNGMAPRDYIRPGQKLVIWWTDKRTTLADISRSTRIGLPRDTVTQRINYTVRKGDSLSRISQRFNVTISKLRQWNSLPKGKYLQPGQKLTLFVDVTRQTENI